MNHPDYKELISLCAKLGEKIGANVNPDGSCRFDVGRVKAMLLLAIEILDKSADNN